MAEERWIAVRDGQLVLVTELDGAAFLHARGRGRQTRWEMVVTLDQLAAQFGSDSRLVHEARTALEALHG